MTWKHIKDCLPDIKNLNETSDLDRMDEMTYPTLRPEVSDAIDLIKKQAADILALMNHVDAMGKTIIRLEKKIADMERKPQYEKTTGV